MDFFHFNKIYVIESLNENKTGQELYDSLIQRMAFKYKELHTQFCEIESSEQWDTLMDNILDECGNDIIPLLHLEIHGSQSGVVLKNGDLISVLHLGEQFRKINIACGCNLFVTLGVCKGLNILLNMSMDKPMPFIGAIGSFCNILEDDLRIRYFDFYETLFETFDIAKSFIALSKANPDCPSTYQYIPADELFYKNYSIYLKEKCSIDALKKRADECMPIICSSRQQKRRFKCDFIKTERMNRAKYFKEHTTSFFMIDIFPENFERFHVPSNLSELEERYKNLVLL